MYGTAAPVVPSSTGAVAGVDGFQVYTWPFATCVMKKIIPSLARCAIAADAVPEYPVNWLVTVPLEFTT
jgi:hypothetical protein